MSCSSGSMLCPLVDELRSSSCDDGESGEVAHHSWPSCASKEKVRLGVHKNQRRKTMFFYVMSMNLEDSLERVEWMTVNYDEAILRASELECDNDDQNIVYWVEAEVVG